jgi:2,4-dienoyl-CoA reductase-like NADH-dependent reductase (Old Yellow Enzyme family)
MSPSVRWPSQDVSPAPLGKPLTFEFSGRTAPNRFLKGAMTERLATWDPKDIGARGVPTKELINLYKRWGEGNYGVILTGNILIDPEHLEAAGNPVIPRTAPFNGERFEAYKTMAAEAKRHGSLCIGQVNHPGRQVAEHLQAQPISASDVQLEGNNMGMTFGKPKAASQEDINGLIEGWAHAAEYLENAGYDGIQLHAGKDRSVWPRCWLLANMWQLTDTFFLNSYLQQRTGGQTSTAAV